MPFYGVAWKRGVRMHFRRYLLGLAVASVAAPGAHAADAVVVAEPEPMEYMRVCDAYGVGFYYIPGTETCLKLSGYIRTDIGAEAFGMNVIDKRDFLEEEPWLGEPADFLNNTYNVRTRFQFRADARAETELGTVRGYAAINFDWRTEEIGGEEFWYYYYNGNGFSTVADDWSMEHAYIELAGFRVGMTDSLFSTFTGFAGGVINDDIINYGPRKTHQLAFGWANDDGLGFAVALEAGRGDDIAPFLPTQNFFFDGPSDIYTIDSYTPHVVAGIGWQGAWGGLSLVAGYDSVWEEGAIKGRVDFYPTDRLSLFVMAGLASYDKDYIDENWWWEFYDGDEWRYLDEKDSPNYYAPWGGSWAVWGGGSFMATDKATFNLQVSYDEMEDLAIVANIAYEVVPNFVITPEIAYIDNFNDDLKDWYESWTDDDGPELIQENWGFFVRAQYNFGG